MRKVQKVNVSELYQPNDQSMIKNFLISNHSIQQKSIEHPILFDGIACAICLRGSGIVRLNMIEYSFAPNTIAMVLPGSVIEFIDRSDDFECEFLIFSFEFIIDFKFAPNPGIKERIEQSACLKISEEECSHLLEFHSFIVKQYNRTNHLYREEMIKYLLFAMLAEVASLYNVSRNIELKVMSHNAILFREMMSLLYIHHKKERNVSFYADKMCLTPKYLSKIMKQVSGKSVLQLINDFVINTSKALLKSSDKTILQISEEMNFPNPSFFGRFFKKHTKMTPKEYRDSF